MLDFLQFLRERKVHYSIAHDRDDALLVTLTLVGARVEVEFFVDDDIEYCVFKGSESISTDEKALINLIKEHTDESQA